MYLGAPKPKRHDSPWRVLVLVILIIGGLYVLRQQVGGASWTRPFDPTPTPTRSAESYFDEAEALYNDGLLDQALVAYRQAFAVDSQDNVALFRLARLMVLRGQTAQVLEQYGSRLQDEKLGNVRTQAVLCMALDWHAPFNNVDLLPVYVSLGVFKADEVQSPDWEYDRDRVARRLVQTAQKVCERALRADPDFPEGYAYLAETLADRERFQEAQAAAQIGIDLNPNIPDTQRAMAYLYEVQGEYEKAIGYYEAAIRAHDRLDFLHIALGRNYRAIGWRMKLQGLPDDKSLPYFQKAVTAFEAAIQVNPRNPQCYDEIGWTYGNYMGSDRAVKQRAIDYLEEALNQDPEYALAYRHLGQVYYYDLRNYEETIPNLEKAIELGGLSTTDEAMSHIMLGWSYYKLDLDNKGRGHECDNARTHFEAAMDALLTLSRRELGLESLAQDGLDACR